MIGRPNVGKSSLFNRLVGENLAICTPKAQTTRLQQKGIVNEAGAQIVFLDTPGLWEKFPGQQKILQQALREESVAASQEADLVLFVLDATGRLDPDDLFLANLLVAERGHLKDVYLVVNKVESGKRTLFDDPGFHAFLQQYTFAKEFKVSAKSGKGLDRVMDALVENLPEGPLLFPEDILSDANDRTLAGEMIRESVFFRLQQELPYAVFVEVTAFKDEPEILRISALIYVERESQKKIVIGLKGAMIKTIGIQSRKRLEAYYQKKVHLELHVKVAQDWTQDVKRLKRLGFRMGKESKPKKTGRAS